MLRRHFKRRNYFAAATARRAEYRWCGVEQVDQAAPIPTRSNGWRYRGEREGETYRRQAVFGAGFRLRLPSPRLSPGPGHRWFNSHPLGGDPDLPDFQAWARMMLRRRLVHRDDADACNRSRVPRPEFLSPSGRHSSSRRTHLHVARIHKHPTGRPSRYFKSLGLEGAMGVVCRCAKYGDSYAYEHSSS